MTTCVVVLYESRTYGPAPCDLVLRAVSALSAVAASALSDPPSALTALELRMPRAEFGTMNGMAGLGVLLVRTTVCASGAVTVMPAIRNEGLPFRFATRLS